MDADAWTKIVEDMKAAIGEPTPIVPRATVVPAGPPLAKSTEPTDEQIRAYLDRHPETLRRFLHQEARARAPWFLRFVQQEIRMRHITITDVLP